MSINKTDAYNTVVRLFNDYWPGFSTYKGSFCVGSDRIRSYAMGTPDVTHLITRRKSAKNGEESHDQAETLLNQMSARLPQYDKTPPKPIAKQRGLLIEYLSSNPPDIHPYAQDQISLYEKKITIAKAKAAIHPALGGAVEALGMPNNGKIDGLETISDIDNYAKNNGIRLKEEAVAKDLIDATIKMNETEIIFDMCRKDIIDLNKCGVHVLLENGVVKCKYIDAGRIIGRHSIYEDGRDQDFRGYTEEMNFSQLVTLLDNDEDVAKVYSACGGAIPFNTGVEQHSWYRNARLTGYDSNLNHNGRVTVLHIWWKESVIEHYITGNRRDGTKIFDRVTHNSKLSDREIRKGKQIKEFRYQALYKASLVLGTNVMFNLGIEDVPYIGIENEKTPQFPIELYVGSEPSIVENCIPHIDEIIKSNFEIRRLRASMAPGPSLYINTNKVSPDIILAGKKLSILDAVALYMEHGIFVFEGAEDMNHISELIGPIQQNVINEIRSNIDTIALEQEAIRNLTAINEVADGTNTNPDMLKGVMQNHIQVALTANMRLVRSEHYFRARVHKNVLNLYLHKGFSENMSDALGIPMESDDIKMLKKRTWSMRIMPNVIQMRNTITQMLNMHAQRLGPARMLSIQQAINDNDIAKAQILLQSYYDQALLQEHQMALQQHAAQPQAQAQAAQTEIALKAELLKIEYALKTQHEIDVITATANTNPPLVPKQQMVPTPLMAEQ
jgi:hypothetical protein